MKKINLVFSKQFLVISMMLLIASALFSQQLGFPGAEGFGRFASGGRGGSVYHVTNLNDSGSGSFREAVSAPNRTVVFDVGGIIRIGNRIPVHSNITIAGQTAPGGGITIYGNGVAFNADSGNGNVIVRYIRVRMGKNGDDGKDALSISKGENYLFDHVSISWGRDGTLDVNGTPIDNLTFQDCIVSQGINISNHSTGGLMQPSGVDGRWSMIRSLYIDNKTRNPKARGRHEFINSVLYNWSEHGYIMGDTTNGESHCNLLGNYFIYGPSSNSGSHITGTTSYFHVYPQDNWIDSNKNGRLDGSLLTDYKTATVERNPYNYPGVNQLMSAQDALNHVIENVGASKVRDAVDEFLINQLKSYGTQGKIITTEDENGIPGNVGTVASGSAPADSDRDGMPDSWERAHGMNPNLADNNGDIDGNGFTNLEEYLNELAGTQGTQPTEVPTPTPTPIVLNSGGSLTLEAENAAYYDAAIETEHTGYTGSGYVNTANQAGGYIEWAINAGSPLQVVCDFRYANGGSTSRPADISVNGRVVAAGMDFPPTNGWTGWTNLSVSLDFNPGVNTIRLTGSGSEGAANIDRLDIAAFGDVTPTPTPPSTPTPTMLNILLGDGNMDGSVDIVDALLIAQYYVGLRPDHFYVDMCDVDCSSTIDIVDALLVAQYYVGLIQQFPGC